MIYGFIRGLNTYFIYIMFFQEEQQSKQESACSSSFLNFLQLNCVVVPMSLDRKHNFIYDNFNGEWVSAEWICFFYSNFLSNQPNNRPTYIILWYFYDKDDD